MIVSLCELLAGRQTGSLGTSWLGRGLFVLWLIIIPLIVSLIVLVFARILLRVLVVALIIIRIVVIPLVIS